MIVVSITGLCNKSLDPASCDSFAPPTPQDLQGFWEMVLLQVNHVDSLNTELATYRANDWKVSDTPSPSPPFHIRSPHMPSRFYRSLIFFLLLNRNQRKTHQKQLHKDQKSPNGQTHHAHPLHLVLRPRQRLPKNRPLPSRLPRNAKNNARNCWK